MLTRHSRRSLSQSRTGLSLHQVFHRRRSHRRPMQAALYIRCCIRTRQVIGVVAKGVVDWALEKAM